MRVVLAIDDTDNLESRGTGEIASLIADAIVEKGWGTTGFVTRHQLLVHPEIPYTSHNSAMCFLAEIADDALEQVISFAGGFLDTECAEGSDPGLCVACVDLVANSAELVQFGRRAKLQVLNMAEAFELAEKLGVHLSCHGGTGQGVIGALAGAGLRLEGSDGRMKGSLDFDGRGELTVAEILKHPHVDAVRPVSGGELGPGALVVVGDKPKTVMQQGRSVLLVVPVQQQGGPAAWQTLHRKQLRGY